MAQAKKKKRFYDVEIPLIKKTTQLLAMDIKELEGRLITYDLTRLLRGKNIILSARVEVKEDKAIANPKSIKVLIQFMKRMVRKGTDYVEGSFIVETKDKKEAKIKFTLVTRRRVSKIVLKSLKKKTEDELTNYISKNKSQEIFEDILKNKLQKELSLKLKKIYPLSLCEFQSFEILEKKKE